ncbi:olfactory receptor 2K2-like [Ambystoma mexicanum]|uniref:olfactory receptor 2K2-like n=1 Tax=Ambystoma mexicanum TaxID=8296 RepID=UPI0037E922B8
MESGNASLITEFILLGFSVPPQMGIVLFVVFLVIYMVTFVANGLIITVVQVDARLNTPMYFFLCNLSFLDLFYSSTNVPACLKGFLSKRDTITFAGCVAQMYLGLTLGNTQGVLLAVMAWDRYVAICNPLNYQRIMSKALCITLAAATWASGLTLAMVEVSLTMTVPFCGHNKINHVVCELVAVLRLACKDVSLIEYVIIVVSVAVLVVPLSLIIITYHRIISTILRMATATSRHKAFSTCGSHLTVVILFYGTTIVMYMRPRSMISTENEKIISVFYGLLTPALNPLIYTLRNKQVKGAVKKLLCREGAWQRTQG